VSKHAAAFVERFIKEASEYAKPYGVSDSQRAARGPLQKYTKPNPSVAMTRTDTAEPRQSINPPPVQ
jgi:hypothetical protein